MVNVKKSTLVVLKMGNSQGADETIKIYIENQVLEHRDTTKYRGEYVNKQLSCNGHIKHMNNKLKLRSYLLQDFLKNIHNSLLKLHIDYGTLAWG